MKLIEMKCPNCQAKLEIDSNQKEFTCKYCRTTTILDEEIIKVEHTIVNNEITEKIKVANTYLLDFEDYNKAVSTFEQLSKEYPYVAEIWWGLIQSTTKNFNDNTINDMDALLLFIIKCDEYFYKYLKIEKDNSLRDANSKKYFEYMETYRKKYLEMLDSYINNQQEHISFENDYINYQDWLENLTNKYTNCSLIWWSLIQIITINFDVDVYYDEEMLDVCDEYMQKYLMTEKNEELKEKHKKIFDEYVNKVRNEAVHTNYKIFTSDVALWIIFVILGIIVLFILIGILIA